MNQDDKFLSVKALICNQHGQFLMRKIKFDSNPIACEIWDLFGAHVRDGESHHAALVRELQKSLGCALDNYDIEDFESIVDSHGAISVINLIDSSSSYKEINESWESDLLWLCLDRLVSLKCSRLVAHHFSVMLKIASKNHPQSGLKVENELLLKLKLRKKNSRVYYALQTPFSINLCDFLILKELASFRGLPWVRICLHVSDDSPIHEMIIAHTSPQLVGPLKQEKSSISYHLIYGNLEITLIDEFRNILSQHYVAADDDLLPFSIRLNSSTFRTVRSLSPSAIFLETAAGPFEDKDTTWMDAVIS